MVDDDVVSLFGVVVAKVVYELAEEGEDTVFGGAFDGGNGAFFERAIQSWPGDVDF